MSGRLISTMKLLCGISAKASREAVKMFSVADGDGV